MTEYQTHAALVATLETEIVRLRAVNAELRSSIQAPIQPDTKLEQAARQAMEVLSELAEWESEGDPRHPASVAITALREALEAQEPWTPDDMAYRPGGLSQHVTDDHQVFKLGYAKGVDDAERRAKARGEQPAAVVKKPVSAIHLGWDRLDNGQLVATYFLPVAEMAAPKLYTTPQPAHQPLEHDEDLLEQLYWEFDDRRQKTGEERLAFKGKMRFYASEVFKKAHGIGGEV